MKTKKEAMKMFLSVFLTVIIFLHCMLTPNEGIYRIWIAPILFIASLLFAVVSILPRRDNQTISRK